MTNTLWQQRQSVRPMHRYLDDGVTGYAPPDNTDDPGDQVAEFQQQMQNADAVAPPAAVPYSAVNNAPPISPDDSGMVPGMVGVTPDMLNAPAAATPPATPPNAFVPPPDPYGYGAAAEKLKRMYQPESPTNPEGFPVRPQPKWYERVAAGALGAAAGYSNAARRAAPIDIGHVTEPILYPGYDQKLASWQSRVQPLQAAMQVAGAQTQASIEAERRQAEAQLKQAQAVAALQHGQYWLNRSQQERNQWKIDPKTGTLYNTVNGQIVNKAQTPQDRKQIAIALGADEGQANYYALNGNLSGYGGTINKGVKTEWQAYMDANNGDSAAALRQQQQDKIRVAKESRNPPDPLIDMARQAQLEKLRNDELDKIGQTKLTAERTLNQQRTQEIDGLLRRMSLGSVDDALATAQGRQAITAINQKYVPQLQNVEDKFRSDAGRRGVQADPFDVYVDQTRPSDIRYRPRPARTAGSGNAAPAGPGPTNRTQAAPVRVTAPDGQVISFDTPDQRDAFLRAHNLTLQ